MIITTSNVLSSYTPVVTTGPSTDDPLNILDADFSLLYKSSDLMRLTVDFGAVPSINYVAVAGTNIQGNKDGTSRVRVYDGSTLIRTINVSNNQAVVLSFTAQAFTNLRVGLYNDKGDLEPILRYVAGGTALTIPNGGEQAGYNRQFLNRNVTNKTTVNSLSAPVAQLKKAKQARGKLSLPNMTKAFSEGEWQTFLDFASSNVFFIAEQEASHVTEFQGTNPSCYLCYDLGKNLVASHAQTRSLNNISIDFKVYNGL